MKQNLIVKSSESVIKVHKEYLQVKSLYDERVIGFKNIASMYVNKTVVLSLSDCIKLMAHFPLFITDQHGNVLAKLTEEGV